MYVLQKRKFSQHENFANLGYRQFTSMHEIFRQLRSSAFQWWFRGSRAICEIRKNFLHVKFNVLLCLLGQNEFPLLISLFPAIHSILTFEAVPWFQVLVGIKYLDTTSYSSLLREAETGGQKVIDESHRIICNRSQLDKTLTTRRLLTCGFTRACCGT